MNASELNQEHVYTVDVLLHGSEPYPCVICGKQRQAPIHTVSTAELSTRRQRVAWLLWCADQGYLLKADRDVLDDAATARGESANLFLQPLDQLHADDLRDREGWLQLADAVIAAIQSEEK